MEVCKCLDLTEQGERIIDDCNKVEELLADYLRVYAGSSFCGKHFIMSCYKVIEQIYEFCKNNAVPITLTVPVFSEGELDEGKKKMLSIIRDFGDVIDEITVNDFGMASFVRSEAVPGDKVKLRSGRLMHKNPRDIRYPEYEQGTTEILQDEWEDFDGIDTDIVTDKINVDAPAGRSFAIYSDYVYMTTGGICDFSGTAKDAFSKFVSNDNCRHDCMNTNIRYKDSEGRTYVRVGKTVFYLKGGNPSITGIESYRAISMPGKWLEQ